MSKQILEIISVTGPEFVKTPRGGYNFVEVAYKKDGKVAGKKLIDFANKGVFNFVKGLKQGDKIEVTAEKDSNDFWQWTNAALASGASESVGEADAEVEQTEGSTDAGSETTTSRSPVRGRGKVTGSNYETPEERAIRREFDRVKHRQIGRQGCINSAIAYMNANFKEITVEDILETAKKFEDYAFQDVK